MANCLLWNNVATANCETKNREVRGAEVRTADQRTANSQLWKSEPWSASVGMNIGGRHSANRKVRTRNWRNKVQKYELPTAKRETQKYL